MYDEIILRLLLDASHQDNAEMLKTLECVNLIEKAKREARQKALNQILNTEVEESN